MGNLYALRRGVTAGPSLLVSAHSDEIVESSRASIGVAFCGSIPGGHTALHARGAARARPRAHGGHRRQVGSPADRGGKGACSATDYLYIDVGAETAADVAAMASLWGIRWLITAPGLHDQPRPRMWQGYR